MEKWIGGGIPYGYEYNHLNKKLVINQEESKILKEIFKWIISGKGTTLIANELNSQNIFSRRGKKWFSATISNILSPVRLKFYLGYDNNDKFGNWAPIISKEDYYLIEKTRKRKQFQKSPNQAEKKERYLLSGIGISYCGYCGGNIKASVTGKKERKLFYYHCSTRHNSGKSACKDSKLIPMQKVDDIVIKDLSRRITSDSIQNIVDYVTTVRAHKLEEITSLTRTTLERLLSNIKIDPDKAFDEYQNNLSAIELLWGEYKSIGGPSINESYSNQEMILNNISKLELKNDSLTIIYKFPITSDLSFKILYKLL